MQVVEQGFFWIRKPEYPLELIEYAGRTCYKSEEKRTKDSAKKFVKMIIDRGHESVIEHATATLKFVTDRGVTHELVRHRLASYSQESTRYCNYGGDHINFVRPVWSKLKCNIYTALPDDPKLDQAELAWAAAMLDSEEYYNRLLERGWRPEQARSVLPNSLKTEIVMTANIREWRHVFKLRCSKAAHPQIRELMLPCLEEFKKEVPIIFDDLEV